MKGTLSIKERLLVASIYALLILGIGVYFSANFRFLTDTSNRLNSVLIVVAVALILGYYVTEPHFTKPVEVIARWLAIALFVIGLNERLWLHDYWIITSVLFIFIAIAVIFLHGIGRFEKYQRAVTDLICRLSRPEILFALLYFDTVFSLFRPGSAEYPVLIGFGFLLAVDKPVVYLVRFLGSQIENFTEANERAEVVGKVIGYNSQDLYTVEVSSDNTHSKNLLTGKCVYLDTEEGGILGAVLNERILLGKKWVDVISLRDRNNRRICYKMDSIRTLAGEKSIFSKSGSVYLFDPTNLDDEAKKLVEESPISIGLSRLIGCVWEGSSINKIRFNKLFSQDFLRKHEIGEGSIIQTEIAGSEVLYQIIDARTIEENLEHRDSHGFIVGTAQKLGKYDPVAFELNTAKWLPEILTPIFLLEEKEIDFDPKKFIGRLPNTNYGIPICSPNDLVTHNAAILGILGIGKSCLTFELIQKVLDQTEVKVICIDLTNQYSNAMAQYIDRELIQDGIGSEAENELRESVKTGNTDNANTWGNEEKYAEILDRELGVFIAGEKRLLTLNPDWHKVEKANATFKITHNEPLTAAQKTRKIAERVFNCAREKGETTDARFLLVFEEAHSLIPEWNSVANDGDKNATNGTAKVILQGRKYGLGSFVITQRTANISKSVLNQCNTIFAMRIFDDTGKQFLENYVGSDYSNLLPTLEERHCIAIGKALKLKQPVVLKLNDMNEVTLEAPSDTILIQTP